MTDSANLKGEVESRSACFAAIGWFIHDTLDLMIVQKSSVQMHISVDLNLLLSSGLSHLLLLTMGQKPWLSA